MLARTLYEQGTISKELSEEIVKPETDIEWNPQPRPINIVTYPEGKAARAVVTRIANMYRQPLWDEEQSEWRVNRWNMEVTTPYDGDLLRRTESYLSRLYDEEFLRDQGLLQLLQVRARGELPLDQVRYVVFLGQVGEDKNDVLVGTDTWKGQFNLFNRANLEMGSTSKLYTLSQYLMIIEGV